MKKMIFGVVMACVLFIGVTHADACVLNFGLAVTQGDLSAVQKFIDAGKDIDSKVEDWTMLMYAANYGQKECVELLLKNGADVHIKAKDGRTVLDLAHTDLIPLIENHINQQQERRLKNTKSARN